MGRTHESNPPLAPGAGSPPGAACSACLFFSTRSRSPNMDLPHKRGACSFVAQTQLRFARSAGLSPIVHSPPPPRVRGRRPQHVCDMDLSFPSLRPTLCNELWLPTPGQNEEKDLRAREARLAMRYQMVTDYQAPAPIGFELHGGGAGARAKGRAAPDSHDGDLSGQEEGDEDEGEGSTDEDMQSEEETEW